MTIDIDNVRDHIEHWENRLDKWDGVIKVADTTVLDTEKVLAQADRALEVAEQKIEENRHLLPKIAIGLAVAGVAVGLVIVLKKRRKAAEEWQVMEQPDTDVAPVADLKKTVTKATEEAPSTTDEVVDAAPPPSGGPETPPTS